MPENDTDRRYLQRAHWSEHKKICAKLRDADNVPDLDQLHSRLEEMTKALYGTHAPVSERIRWHSVHATDPKSRRVREFLDKLDVEHVAQYAVRLSDRYFERS